LAILPESRKARSPKRRQVEEAIAKLDHVNVSGAKRQHRGQPAYTVRVTPKEGGSLIGRRRALMGRRQRPAAACGAVLLTSSSPVIELAASEISFGPVSSSVFEFTAPADAKVEEIKLSSAPAHHGHRLLGDATTRR